ncbi:MAG TPA: hypothetical protein VFA18_07805, partial [Gemmataceae bacterium]|nr:hypothetical protein [Gemmataceae bacterium]
MSATVDRNLLFGILALQKDFISQDALNTALRAWLLDTSQSLGSILVQHQALSAERHAVLEGLVTERLRQHDGHAGQSLAAVAASALDECSQETTDLEGLASLTPPDDLPEPPGDSPVSFLRRLLPAKQRFTIQRPHAIGGLGQVYLALDREL